MKKLLFVFTALMLFACSSSDDNSNTSQNPISINPPDWIQGTWSNSQITFKITSNDIYENDNSLRKYLETFLKQNGGEANADESKNTDFYQVNYYYSSGIGGDGSGGSSSYTFYKMSPTVINCQGRGGTTYSLLVKKQ